MTKKRLRISLNSRKANYLWLRRKGEAKKGREGVKPRENVRKGAESERFSKV